MNTSFITLQTIIGQFINDFGVNETEIDEDLLMIWGEDGVAEISTDEQLTLKMCILDIDGYNTRKPSDFKILCEIAYRLEKPDKCPTRREQLTKFTQNLGDGCELDISIRCPKCHKTECKGGCGVDGQQPVYVEVDRIWELANSYYNHSTQFMTQEGVQTFGRGEYPSMYDDSFRLMRPASGSWFQVNKHIPNCANLCCPPTNHEYSIDGDNIEVDFKKGEVLLSYLGSRTDENGNLMVPDHRNAVEAVVMYIGMKWLFRQMMMNPNDRGIAQRYAIVSQQSDIAIGRARSALQIPSMREWNEWLRNSRYAKIDGALDNFYHGRTTIDKIREDRYNRGYPNTTHFGANDKYRG